MKSLFSSCVYRTSVMIQMKPGIHCQQKTKYSAKNPYVEMKVRAWEGLGQHRRLQHIKLH